MVDGRDKRLDVKDISSETQIYNKLKFLRDQKRRLMSEMSNDE